MADTGVISPPPSPTASLPGGGGGGGLKGYVTTHKGPAVAVLVVVLGSLGLLWEKHKASGAAASSTTGGATSTGPAVYEIAPGSTGENDMSGLQTQLESMIAGQQAGSTTASNAANPNQSSKYAPISYQGHQYELLPNPAAAHQAEAAHLKLFVQIAPGVFAADTPSTPAGGGVYVQSS